ncbi:hypothetical protein KZ813_18230 [Sphingomonas sp. RHCKR7]|uniref:hypothetical protein n=1 Tax=Sphingomonas folli TaxID=2862497 RepID=UPI001CA59AE3|nr:hypothetical protein [Sphingomonas folli]MBW6528783.1 hypothetical protein [Sphingomonas folli]
MRGERSERAAGATVPAAAAAQVRATALDAATRACFLDQLAMLGCPARAAAATGIAPVSAYALRRRNARFAAAWRAALAIGYERLEAEALRHLLDRETPLDLAAALALLDRHRAAAAGTAAGTAPGADPVPAPRARRGRRGALDPAGAELARRLQLYAGATPRVRRTPVSPAAAAEVDALERAAAADWGEVDDQLSDGDTDARPGPGAAETEAVTGSGIATGGAAADPAGHRSPPPPSAVAIGVGSPADDGGGARPIATTRADDRSAGETPLAGPAAEARLAGAAVETPPGDAAAGPALAPSCPGDADRRHAAWHDPPDAAPIAPDRRDGAPRAAGRFPAPPGRAAGAPALTFAPGARPRVWA